MRKHVFVSGCLGLAVLSVLAIRNAAADQTITLVPCSDARGCPNLHASISQTKIQSQSFSATDCAVQEGEVPAGTRKLLRFSSFTPNIGPGSLILGDPVNGPNSGFYVWAPCHGHYHFKDYAAYRLWKPADYQTWKQRRQDPAYASIPSSFLVQGYDTKGHQLPVGALSFVAGHKQGFCAIDIVNIPKFPNTDPRTYTVCGNMTTPGNQGISVGWADEYVFQLDGQWIDITDVASGSYVLEVETNPTWAIQEKNYLDNSYAVSVTIP